MDYFIEDEIYIDLDTVFAMKTAHYGVPDAPGYEVRWNVWLATIHTPLSLPQEQGDKLHALMVKRADSSSRGRFSPYPK